MRNRLGKLLVVLFLIVSVGGHWALLQSFAWVTMFIDYSRTAPIAEAVSKTFNGENPCGLCKMVKKGKASEEKQEAIKVKTKVDFWIAANEAQLLPSALAERASTVHRDSLSSRADSPPIPPPRRA